MNDRNSAPPNESETAEQVADSVAGQNSLGDLRIRDLLSTATGLLDQAARHPAVVAEESARFMRELLVILSGQSDLGPPPDDKRFTDPAWRENIVFKTLLQGYWAWSQSLQNYADKAGLDPRATGRAKFLLSQISDAFAPTNSLFGNPAA
jgi:polyhydroxyalkanoate synthase